MKNIILLLLAMTVISCGKKVETKYVENLYDDSRVTELEAKLAANDATIANLLVTLTDLSQSLQNFEDTEGELLAIIEDLQAENDFILEELKKLKDKKRYANDDGVRSFRT